MSSLLNIETSLKQLVTKPTHVQGRLIDCMFHFAPTLNDPNGIIVKQTSPYFSDHDILSIHQVTKTI